MKIGQLAQSIARKEGHTSKTRIDDLKKVLNVLADMSYNSADPIHAITQLGISRAKQRKK